MSNNATHSISKRSSDSVLGEAAHALQPPHKRHGSLERALSAPQSRTNAHSRARSVSPVRRNRKHPYQYTGAPITPTKQPLSIHTKHISIDNGLPSPIPSPQKQCTTAADRLLPLAHFADLSLRPATPDAETSRPALRAGSPARAAATLTPHAVFATPEIVNRILGHLCAMEKGGAKGTGARGTLHSCALVNRLWNDVAMGYLLRDLSFTDSGKFVDYMLRSKTLYAQGRNAALTPRSLSLHKLGNLRTQDLAVGMSAAPVHFRALEAMQFYICPNLLPPNAWFPQLANLRKLALPGNRQVDDKFMIEASLHLTRLEHLDLRACGSISDVGVVSIASRCRNLKLINLGRHKNGQRITDVSLVALGKYTDVQTVGVAGCDVTDSGLWEFAKVNGANVRRLSVNNCRLLTNMSLPYLFAYNYFPNLVVLEIRNVEQFTNVKPLVKFSMWRKAQGSPLLVESCDRVSQLLRAEEDRLRKKRALTSLREMNQWVNAMDEA
ncbi:Amn1 protein [Maudiozyma humilis]|uniref:Amn1 protein n=1 Tax=Maudiozyma humilis TaxID=51915 RepID=A0AAV5RYD7_MAUHU|nr:Amn1 protein [Kazachstania humilis]